MKFLVLLLIPSLVNASNLTQFFPSSSGGTINAQEFTASGTWTRPASVNFVDVECIGGGGGGGRGAGPSASNYHGTGGGGGASGVYVKLENIAVSGNVTVTIGTGGAGGTSTVGASEAARRVHLEVSCSPQVAWVVLAENRLTRGELPLRLEETAEKGGLRANPHKVELHRDVLRLLVARFLRPVEPWGPMPVVVLRAGAVGPVVEVVGWPAAMVVMVAMLEPTQPLAAQPQRTPVREAAVSGTLPRATEAPVAPVGAA